MKIKVCGMREHENIASLIEMPINYIGFIFYKPSKRFVGEDFIMPEIPTGIKKTGVFVNKNADYILEKVERYNLQAVQLHGNESPEYCNEIKKKRVKVEVIKAFSVDSKFDFSITNAYEACTDFFLFDTKTDAYGGSGQKFDWDVLQKFYGENYFFLSGGIDVNDVENISKLKHNKLYALDINSKFEISPAYKDLEKIKQFLSKLFK